MNITGQTMIWKNDIGYSTTISNKNKEGKWENMYIAVQLPKDVELENQTKINITKGFLSFFKSKEGMPKIKAVIMEFETEEKEDSFIPDDDRITFLKKVKIKKGFYKVMSYNILRATKGYT